LEKQKKIFIIRRVLPVSRYFSELRNRPKYERKKSICIDFDYILKNDHDHKKTYQNYINLKESLATVKENQNLFKKIRNKFSSYKTKNGIQNLQIGIGKNKGSNVNK